MKQVGAILEVEPRLDLKLDDEHGLRWTTKAIFPGTNWELVFNKSLRRPSGSYSLGLRPDFALTGAGGLLIFDAKFRFNERDVDRMAAEDAEQALEQDIQQGSVERVAKQVDLYKMHTYRDALQARAAVALYPGNKAEFFDVERGQRRDLTLANLLEDDGWRGIGALPLRPEA